MSPEYHLSMFFWVDHFDTNCGTVSENKEPRRIQCIIDFTIDFNHQIIGCLFIQFPKDRESFKR